LLLAGGLVAARRRRTAAPDADFAVAVQPAMTPPPDVARAAAAVPLAAGGLAAGALAQTTDAQAEVREADDVGEAVVESDAPVQADATPGIESREATLNGDDQLPAEALSDLEPEPAQQAAGDVASDELVDVVGEADIYVAYGRFGQASTLLQNALVDDPDHHEARLKLLEIFAETGDQAAFDREHAQLVSRCQDTAMLGTAASLAAQLGGAAPSAAAAMPTLDDLEPGATPAVDALAFDEFEFELPDEPQSDESVSPGASVAEQDSFEAPVDFGEPLVFDEPVQEGEIPELDMEITLDDAAIPELPDVAAPDSDLLGGDRGIDFRLEEDDLEELDEAELALEMDGTPPEEDEFEFGDEGDSASTKLDLARAYSEMGDPDGAREILLEVLKEGTEAQQQAAQELLDRL
jgi:pilus assembly protein FimV